MIKTHIFKDKLDSKGGYSVIAENEYEMFIRNNCDLDVIHVQSRKVVVGDIKINQIFVTYAA